MLHTGVGERRPVVRLRHIITIKETVCSSNNKWFKLRARICQVSLNLSLLMFNNHRYSKLNVGSVASHQILQVSHKVLSTMNILPVSQLLRRSRRKVIQKDTHSAQHHGRLHNYWELNHQMSTWKLWPTHQGTARPH